MKHLSAAYRALNLLLAIIAGALIIVMTVMISAEAISRSLGLGVIRGVVDVAEHSMFCIALLSAPWILAQNGHIRINLLTAAISEKANIILSLVTEGLCFVLCVWIAYEGWFIFWHGFQSGELVFADLIFPDWYLLWQTPVAFALMAVEFAHRVYRALQGENLNAPEVYEAEDV